MQGHVFRLVLLVSCAHALVHLYELSLPSVEQEISSEFYPDDAQSGKELSGQLSNYWRLFWGFGALAAGWLVDRFGGRSMLAIYLFGCGIACLLSAVTKTTWELTVCMLVMGGFASIYHPAGLALIANETSPENRPRALGFHGILGSIGIGSGPLLAWLLVKAGFSWRGYFAFLAIPGLLLGFVFVLSGIRAARERAAKKEEHIPSPDNENHAQWIAFGTLTVLAFLQGFVYAAQMSFLPRYLTPDETITADLDPTAATRETTLTKVAAQSTGDPTASSDEGIDERNTANAMTDRGKLLASIALLLGCVGQFLAGKYARHQWLEPQIAWITFANVPFLVWMAFATGWGRPVAACMFALVHFMHQPVYNSLIPKYTPRKMRSLCFGFSISIGLGCGSFGARFAGAYMNDVVVYGTLAGLSCIASGVGLLLWWIQIRRNSSEELDATG